jgi:hypothetical protein
MPIDIKELKSLRDRISELGKKFLKAPAQKPSYISFPNDHVIANKKVCPSKEFEQEKDYFEVTVDELYLSFQSKLWVKLDPTAFVTTELLYDDKKVSVPFVVGPSMMKNIDDATIPVGGKMVYENTKVAGLYPYKGGDLNLSVILCQLSRQDIAKRIMKIVTAVASALDYSTQLSSYLKIANVVIDGIEEIMGIQGLSPLIGHSYGFHEGKDPKPQTGSYALVNIPQGQIDEDQLWVVDNHLKEGKDWEHAKPLLSADYLLFSINGTTTRKDCRLLPFWSTWKTVEADARRDDNDSWKRAKAGMATLYAAMYDSPDLIQTQAKALKIEFQQKMEDLHNDAIQPAQPPAPTPQLSAEDKKAIKESVKILGLR